MADFANDAERHERRGALVSIRMYACISGAVGHSLWFSDNGRLFVTVGMQPGPFQSELSNSR